MRYSTCLLLSLLTFSLCVDFTWTQEKQSAPDPRKTLHEISVRLHENTATEADYLLLQKLYQAASEGTNKRIVLHLAAQYRRQVLKNPVRTLDSVLPHLITKDEFDVWKKANQKTLRAIASGEANAAYDLTELPDIAQWRVKGSHGPLALEAARALFALQKIGKAIEIIDAVGRANTDEVRVLAAECAADFCEEIGDFKKANEYFEFAQKLHRDLGHSDYYYEKSDREFDGAERGLIARRLKENLEKTQNALKIQVESIVEPRTLPTLAMQSWPNRQPKVDRLDINAQFIICMIPDGSEAGRARGGAFVGTEDYGVYHYDYSGNVKQYTDKDGMGDPNAYALCIDKRGRLWAGHLNSGVSVFNGQKWRNYDVVDGPIGERVFDIQCCPIDGDVWIATSAGITRYKIDADEWEHFTREDGLLEDQASSLAFKNDGTLLVGTQCHGVAIFSRDRNGNYKHAKNITAPDRFGPGNCSPVPILPFGTELPTNQINQILVARNETVWIATPTGLVKSDKNLSNLQCVRGKDYADKVRGLYGGAPKTWKECPPEIMEQLLPEDYVTCLSEDKNGTIWIGTRQKGFMAIDPVTGRRGTGDRASMGMADNYVSAILPMPDAMPLIGLYIGGVIKPQMDLSLKTKNKPKEGRPIYSVARSHFAPLPSPIKPPTVAEIKSMQAKLEKLNKPLPKVYAAYYGEDWKTQGDWVGRYGYQYAVLCAVDGHRDRYMYRHRKEIQVNDFIGPNTPQYDVIRRWIHWLKTDDKRVLYDPYTGARRQAEWDDHGEVYPMTKDGPHLWYLLQLKKKGVYRLSMYFFNKDGHTGHNRHRDYLIKVYPFKQPWLEFDKWPLFSIETEKQVRKGPPLAQSRVRDFWGGAYKTFVVNGPGVYAVKIDSNYSFNTILSSVMVDRMIGEADHFDKVPMRWIYTPYYAPKMPGSELFRTEEGKAAHDAWTTLSKQRDKVGAAAMEKEMEWRIFRMAALSVSRGEARGLPAVGEKRLVNHLVWKVKYWNEDLRDDFKKSMEISWEKFCELHPQIVAGMNTKRVDKPRPRTPIDIWSKKQR